MRTICHVDQSRRLRRTAGRPVAAHPGRAARRLARRDQGVLAARAGQLPEGRGGHSRAGARRFAGRSLDRECAAGGQGSRRGRGRRSGHRLADAGLEDFGRGDRTAARHRADRGQPAGRRAAVPQVSAIHQHPDRAGAARRAADARQARSAVPAADAGRPAALGAVGRARAPHQLRRADPLLRPRIERVAGHAAEGAQGHAAGGRAAPHQHVSARLVGARLLHASDLRRLRIARRLPALHRGLPAACAGCVRRFRPPLPSGERDGHRNIDAAPHPRPRSTGGGDRFPVSNSIVPPPRTAPRTSSKPNSRFPPKRSTPCRWR